MKSLWHILVLLSSIGCSLPEGTPIETHVPLQQTSVRETYVAGDVITLKFKSASRKNVFLKIEYGWGSSLLQPTGGDTLQFAVPDFIRQKSGRMDWIVFQNREVLDQGFVRIQSAEVEAEIMETYLGPTRIFAHPNDQSMVVALPQDHFGNPLPDGSFVSMTTQNRYHSQTKMIPTRAGFAYSYISGSTSVGSLFLGLQYKNQTSKELTVDVLPFRAVDFQIQAHQKHSYADGNQIISFSTSDIRDDFGNTVTDGTLVQFLVKTDSGKTLQTNGQTINGRATGQLLHPAKPETWTVRGQINGVVQSPPIEIRFESTITKFQIALSPKSDSVIVGPILSYMGQLIPDGTRVEWCIKDKATIILYQSESDTRKGKAFLEIPHRFRNHNVQIEVTTGGSTNILTLSNE